MRRKVDGELERINIKVVYYKISGNLPTKTKENQKTLSILIPVHDLNWVPLKYNPMVLQHTERLPSECGI
jgi:hypothetical protein